LQTIIGYLRLLLLGLWLGAAVFFGAAVAPTVFGVLRGAQLANSGELAGMMVQRLLAVINRGGFEISLFLLVTGYFVSRKESRLARFAEMISLAIMAIMTGVGQWVIAARMSALRAAMQGHIDQVALNDPRRIAFDSLHGYSVTAMGVAMVAGLVAFVIMARGSSPTVREGSLSPRKD
jgi:Domain of unknown function (DUF4149)